MSKHKIALVVGHEPRAPGAVAVDGTTEYEWNLRHAALLEMAINAAGRGCCAEIVLRNPGDYRGLPEKVNATGAACFISLHWNASSIEQANGSEVLYYFASKASRALASALDIADNVLELRNRHGGTLGRGWYVVRLSEEDRNPTIHPGPLTKQAAKAFAANYGPQAKVRSHRGTHLLFNTSMPGVIVEPAFGTNSFDWHRLNERQELLAEAQADAIVAWLGRKGRR